MPRVLRIINRLNLGGPTYNAAYLTRYLPAAYQTQLVAGIREDHEASSAYILEEMGIAPTYIPEMQRPIHPLKDRAAYLKIRDIIRDFRPHIVHTHAAKAGALGRLAAINEQVPVVLHTFHGHVFHSYFNPIKTRTFLAIERYLARKSTKIIAISDTQKQELSAVHRVCPPEQIEVIPLGFDLQRFHQGQAEKRKAFRKRFKIAPYEVAIGIIGRLVPVKNHALFLEAFARVYHTSPVKVRAFVVGDGALMEALQALARKLHIPFTVGHPPLEVQPLTFTSWMRNIDEVNAGMDIIALSSLNEGTPVSLIEAQAASKPIVSTRTGGIEDVVLEGQTALLSAVDDLAGYAHHLQLLVADADLRKRMSEKGHAFVMERFHYQRLVKDMAYLYDRLLGEVTIPVAAR